MARRPSVFVRALSMEEGQKLQRITRTAKNPVRMRRAIVVMMSGQGQTVRDINSLLQVSEDYVRDVIHAFNERGFDALDPKPSGVRPEKIGEQLRTWICAIVRTSPSGWGITERLEQGSRQILRIGQGSLYPALYRLERQGYVASTWNITENNRRARYYELTVAGRARLAEERQAWRRMSRAVELILALE